MALNLWLRLPRDIDLRQLEHLAAKLDDPATVASLLTTFDPQLRSVRFSGLLPQALYQSMQGQRMFDVPGCPCPLSRQVRVTDSAGGVG